MFFEYGLISFESVFKFVESVFKFVESLLKFVESLLKFVESVLMFLEYGLIFFESVLKFEIDRGAFGGSESPDFGRKLAEIDGVLLPLTSVIPADAIFIAPRWAGTGRRKNRRRRRDRGRRRPRIAD